MKKMILLLSIWTAAFSLWSDNVTKGPIPAWTTPYDIDLSLEVPSDAAGGAYLLLSNMQRLLSNDDIQLFYHYATKVYNQKGIENNGQILIDYNPHYETLIINKINIIRGNQITDVLKDSEINIFNTEKDLDYLIYDGTQTANIILEDLRFDDIIEVAYTIKGHNPVFDTHFSGESYLETGLPMGKRIIRLVVQKNQPLNITYYNTQKKPIITEGAEYTEYLWEYSKVESILNDNDTPIWYNPYPRIGISHFKTWKDVHKWGASLFDISVDHKVIKEALESIIDTESTLEDIIIDIIRFTQNEIRYLGVELGINSHKPHDPIETLEKRFGDCKDKSLLLCQLLNEMDIQAYPALVHSYEGNNLNEKQPGYNHFNHVIVYMSYNNKDYWIDPTLTFQKGNLKNMYQPDYGYALVLEPGKSNLIKMDANNLQFKTPHIVVKDSYDISAGLDEKTQSPFITETKYSKDQADNMRYYFANNSIKQISKDYLDYFSDIFPSITPEKELYFQDNDVTNNFTIFEEYLLSDISLPTDTGKNKYYEFEIYPYYIAAYTEEPGNLNRDTPYAIDYPLHIVQEINVSVPSYWDYDSQERIVENDVFYYSEKFINTEGMIKAKYIFKTKKDHAAPDELKEYAEDIKKINDKIVTILSTEDFKNNWYDTRSSNNSKQDLNQILTYLIIIGIAVFIYLFRKGRR